ncbi:hypothetical protein MSG28_011352 [Choristoneura fumiferana]|uniref:Uncharacterized protein n=1 Tax=Choristoneura fumiferana TaxID=7141 RepID=A0ACC0JMZ7_CHOFU|nr:hypothetical protein MSG28_011352 [Choristoneura fumiferana]
MVCFVSGAVCCNIIGHGCLLGFPGVLLPQLHAPGSSIAALLIGRVLHGISFGMFMPLRSVLIGEYTSPKNRGGFLTTIALAQAFGILFVHFVGSVTSFQMAAFISMFFSFISLLMTIYSPESPSWLATQGRYDECRKVFIWLRGHDETPELEKMIKATQVKEEAPTQKQNFLKEMVEVAKKKEFYKPVLLMFAVYIMLQFAGGTLMASYSTKVIELLMGPDVDAHFWMVALDTQRIFFNIIAVYVINKVKIRTMMFATGSLCAGCHLAMASYVYAKINGLLPFDSLWIPGILINLQIVSVAMGMVPLPSVIAGEVFPLQYRSLGGSISLVAVAGTIFLVLKTFPGLISLMGLHGTYTLYSGILTACLVVTYFLLPETRGKTLQQIEEHFRGKPLVDPETEGKELTPLNGSEKKSLP